MKRIIIPMILMMAVNASSAAPLSLQQCIQLALEKHPQIISLQESRNASRSRVDQAAAPFLPQVQASTGYSESHQSGGAFGDSATKSYATTLSVNQIIYDFGRTGNARSAAKAGAGSAEIDVQRARAEVVLNVKQAYYALLQAKRLLTVAQQSLAQTESHLQQAQAFFNAGSKPRFDVTRAEVDVNNTRLGLINAQNTVRLNTISLYNAVGLDPAGDIEIEDIPAQSEPVPVLPEAQAKALTNRPEMRKSESDVAAARAKVQAEESNYFPTLAANGAYTWSQGRAQVEFNGISQSNELQNSWNAGITLTIPLFEGGLTRSKVSEARANQRALEAQQTLLRQSILLEVSQAFADLESSSARIAVMDSQLKKARESLGLAEGRYQAGVGPTIDVTDARVAAAKAETDHVQALHDYQLAIARLVKAMGSEN